MIGDLKKDRVPQDFSKLLLEKYREYGGSEDHKKILQYFASRILLEVNAGITKYDKRKYNEALSSCFSYTDEAFRLLLLVNYENRWRSQHEAEQVLLGGTSKERSQRWEDARYTSATEEVWRGSSWPRDRLVKFNELSATVKGQREAAIETEEDTNMVEEDLMDWCRTEDDLDAMAATGGERIAADPITPKEDEVEAWGGCSLTEM